MKKYLLSLLFVLIVIFSNAQEEHFYEIDLEYDHGNLKLLKIEVKPLLQGIDMKNREGIYDADAVSFDNKTIKKISFDIPLDAIYESFDPQTGNPSGGGIAKLEKTQTFIRLPYYENIKEINIYEENTKVLTIDVSQFAKNKCGDGVCQPDESYQQCRNDCSSRLKDDYCDSLSDGKCDPDCTKKTDADCKGYEQKGATSKVMYAGIGIALLFITLLLWLILKKKEP